MAPTKAPVVSVDDPLAAFIEAVCVPLDGGHASSTLEGAEAILAAHAEVATSSIHAAAILGDDHGVRRFLGLDAANATSTGGPRGWDALTHLCFSRYLRLHRTRSDGFVRTAEALLNHGADPRLVADGTSGVAMAARRGRGDVLEVREALLRAGASVRGVAFPSGYAEVDDLLRRNDKVT